MFDGSGPLGRLLLASTGKGRRYSKDDLDFAYSLAGRAALAVRNARLVAELARQRDIQSQERSEADRRFAELRAVFDSDPNGIALFDAQGLLRMASLRIEEIFGIPLRAMYGQRFDEIYRQKLAQVVSHDREAMLERVRGIFANREARAHDEIELERPRHRWLTRSSVPVRTASGEYLGRLVVYVDVTEHRELDQQRSDFLTVAAHELRTPLTPLSMYLQSIERRLKRGQSVGGDLVSKARRQVERLGTLVEDSARRLAAGVAPHAAQLRGRGDERAGGRRGRRFPRADAQPRHPPSSRRHSDRGGRDRERLEQVLVNLISNAIKYTPQGGRITVSVERAGSEARVSVQDPGIGIPDEEQPRLFQRFFRAANATTRNYSGLGIGLFVAHEIVHRHGGRFEVRSELAKGSTFTFYLPLSQPLRSVDDLRARVLLVDDDPEILEATGQVLREWGYTVDEACDAQTALTLARNSKPDLMIIDLMMPVIDGRTLIRRLREENVAADVPLVVFSADRDVPDKARNVDADAALRKPFELEELQEVVERLLPSKPAA